jgi:hypothetical protein
MYSATLFLDLGTRRGQRHAPAAFYPMERPGTHCTGGWVGPRASLDCCGKSRSHRDSIPGPSSRCVFSFLQMLHIDLSSREWKCPQQRPQVRDMVSNYGVNGTRIGSNYIERQKVRKEGRSNGRKISSNVIHT